MNETSYINDESYNGHKNYQTWNVSLWINNDEGLYSMAIVCSDYKQLLDALVEVGITATNDGVSFADRDLDFNALNELVNEAV